jgi:hypothetical protein
VPPLSLLLILLPLFPLLTLLPLIPTLPLLPLSPQLRSSPPGRRIITAAVLAPEGVTADFHRQTWPPDHVARLHRQTAPLLPLLPLSPQLRSSRQAVA